MPRHRSQPAPVLRSCLAALILLITGLACNLPNAAPPASPPQPTAEVKQMEAESPTAPAEPTVTAGTAASTELPAGEPTSTTAPESPADPSSPSLLPQALYFLAGDPAGLQQIWRAAPDGVGLDQISSLASAITDFDVHSDGRLAWITNNQLWLGKPGAPDAVLVADGGPDDSSEEWIYTRRIETPRFSPNGQFLAYSMDGLHLYTLTTGSDNLVMPDELEDIDGYLYPRRMFAPVEWSPDGTRLLISISYLEAGTFAIYDAGTGVTTSLSKPSGEMVCCNAAWSPDGASLVMAGFTYGSLSSDLWRYSIATGEGTNLIPIEASDGTYNMVDYPLVLPDGSLRYFFANLPAPPTEPAALLMTQSGPDGVAGRTPLRPEGLFLQDVLWAPDGSLAAIIQPPAGELTWPPSGPIVLVFADGRPNRPVATDGRLLHWGP